MNSFAFLTGSDGCVTNMNGVSVTRVTAEKSFNALYASFLYRLGLIAVDTVPMNIV